MFGDSKLHFWWWGWLPNLVRTFLGKLFGPWLHTWKERVKKNQFSINRKFQKTTRPCGYAGRFAPADKAVWLATWPYGWARKFFKGTPAVWSPNHGKIAMVRPHRHTKWLLQSYKGKQRWFPWRKMPKNREIRIDLEDGSMEKVRKMRSHQRESEKETWCNGRQKWFGNPKGVTLGMEKWEDEGLWEWRK